MIKEPYRDYATEAFRLWAAAECPTVDESRKRYTGAIRADFVACAEVMRDSEPETAAIVRAVYMARPREKPGKGEISGRVLRYSMEHYLSERQVWERLADARMEFARRRGLRVE